MVKSPALTISRWITLAIYLVMFILSAGVNCQTVSINESDIGSVSTCSSGLRDGTDFYLIKGIVDATVAKYSNLVDFQIKAASSNNFQYLCTASLVTCVTPNPQPCYCAEQNGNKYQIVANRSAVLADSNAMIRIQWDSSSGDSAVSNAVSVPKIYNLNDVTTSLNDDSPWPCPKTLNNGSVITFKCLQSPSPCDVSIAVNNIEVAKGESIAIYTVFTSQASNSTENFKFSHSVCGGSVAATTCLVTIEDDFTTTPASTTAVTNGTTTMTTGTTVAVPTTNSTTASLVTVPPTCPLDCKDWAIALTVIYYIAILVIIFTGIVILVLAITADKKTVFFYLCIVFLVFAVVLDLILIIVFAQAEPCTCDPGSDIQIALWKIMLIIFCIVIGLLIIAVVVVLVWIFIFSKNSKELTGPNRGNAETAPTTNVSAQNTRTQKENKVNSITNTTTLSNGNNWKGRTDDTYELQEEAKTKLPNTPDELKKDEAVNNVKGDSENKKGKKKKTKNKNKDTKEQEKESSSTYRNLPVPQSGDKKLLAIHSQPPKGTKLNTLNPYG